MGHTEAAQGGAEAPDRDPRLPPGQRIQRGWPVLHYGPVPRFKPEIWDFRVFGATASGDKHCWNYDEFSALPHESVIADFHCVTKFSMLGNDWSGLTVARLLEIAPPAPEVTHAMVWAEYGFSSNLRMFDFTNDKTILATHHNGEPLTAEHGFPVRLIVPHLYAWKGPKWVRGIEYMVADKRGFWEERGYHNIGDPWQEQRYSYQEEAGQGPALT